ncbi:hypothetical protein H6P81_002680 [Aristolochia fimbriata]|uniref:Uncharacterized protein n=1 Tax=Aristolochia fimbriata TaxID=158543 RepID=A0AAV7FDN2_ARIFI|nr:hypothetical protein H6P81_002680 [Aristolochia fimbriata]
MMESKKRQGLDDYKKMKGEKYWIGEVTLEKVIRRGGDDGESKYQWRESDHEKVFNIYLRVKLWIEKSDIENYWDRDQKPSSIAPTFTT